jgi:ATP-dependent 26S proteasome regulatory subunit
MATGAYAQTDTTTTSTTTTTTEQGKRDKDKEKVEKEKVRVNENDRNRDNVKETTTTETTAGTVEEYTPGESIVVRTAAAEPVHYRLSKQVVYVNAAGQVVEASAIRKTAHVHYHFVHEGNETVVDRVIVD